MSLSWKDGVIPGMWEVYSNKIMIGKVYTGAGGVDFAWRLYSLHNAPNVSGKAPTKKAAKAALVRRWRSWLKAAGLVEQDAAYKKIAEPELLPYRTVLRSPKKAYG